MLKIEQDEKLDKVFNALLAAHIEPYKMLDLPAFSYFVKFYLEEYWTLDKLIRICKKLIK